MEANRLAYLQRYQEDLRVEKYHRLRDELEERQQHPSQDGGAPIGRRIVLPASYPGSPRAMVQNYYDAMGMVREYGKPDFFLTMTANPMWSEALL